MAAHPIAELSVVSAYGLDQTHLGPQFPALEIVSSLRATELEFRARYYKCRQHDWKVFDWNGTMRRPERFPTQPLIGNAMPDFYVPLNQRRPQTPYRLARTIVGAFTTLIFGHGRWPSILSDDPETQDFAEILVKEAKLKTKMIRARNLGGASGTVGLSWGFVDGKPRVRVHESRHLHVLEWADEDEFIPAHVVELYQYPKDIWNAAKKKNERRFFWHRRDWTTNADISFIPCEVTSENPDYWQIDESKSEQHNDGFCHFVWVQNLPDDEVTTIDGQPDYAELYEQLDAVDIINSVNTGGVVKNLDPTLKLKMHREDVAGAVIRKGSDNALTVGVDGDASYMELSGSAVSAGHEAIRIQREQALETCQCVVPDPNEVAGGATSSVALKIVYAPMLSKGDIMRDQYGEAIITILEGMINSARKRNVGQVVQEPTLDSDGIEVMDEVTGQPVLTPVEYWLDLPPRVEKQEVLDDAGNPTGEIETHYYPRKPGNGRLKCEWPDYFKPTETDRSQQAGSLVTASGGKPIMSQQTAAEHLATSYQRDPTEEWSRIRTEAMQAAASQAEMFPGPGGEVDSYDQLPDGAEPMEGENQDDEAGPAADPEG